MSNINKAVEEVVEVFENFEMTDFKPSELPQIITSQVQKIKTLAEKVENAKRKAKIARDAAQDANKKMNVFSGRKEAIEQLQSSGKSIASAVEENAEAHQLSFEFHKELAEISKFLFGLGVTNIAQNRMVVRELELKMKGASVGEISELAKQELISVVRQLKQSEDILHKLDQNKNNLRRLNERLSLLSDDNEKLNQDIVIVREWNKNHDVQLATLIKASEIHDTKLSALQESDKVYDTELAALIKVNNVHNAELESFRDAKNNQDAELVSLRKANEVHDRKLAALQEADKNRDTELAEQTLINKRQGQEIILLKSHIERDNKKINLLFIGFIVNFLILGVLMLYLLI